MIIKDNHYEIVLNDSYHKLQMFQSCSQSARYPYPVEQETGNKILWDKAFHHDMCNKTGSPRILCASL